MHVEGVLANNDYILNGCYIEITSNCNLRCIHCYNESGELRDQISVEAFKNVLGCYDNPKKASITLSGGEPLLHPQVWKFIDMMLESGILARNILLITNATCITDDVANMLAEKHVSVQVSLNGSRAELHDSICGKGNFERTMAGLQRLLSKHANMVIVRNMMNNQWEEIAMKYSEPVVVQFQSDISLRNSSCAKFSCGGVFTPYQCARNFFSCENFSCSNYNNT